MDLATNEEHYHYHQTCLMTGHNIDPLDMYTLDDEGRDPAHVSLAGDHEPRGVHRHVRGEAARRVIEEEDVGSPHLM